jgi:ribosomal protein S27AE
MNGRHTGKLYVPEFTTYWKMLQHWIHDTLVNDTSLDFMALANATSPERWHTGKCYIPGVYGTCQCYITRITTYLLMLHHSNYDIQYYLLMLHDWIYDILGNTTLLDLCHTGICYFTGFMPHYATSLDSCHTGICYFTGFLTYWKMLHPWIHDILENATSLDRWHTGKCYIPGSMTYRQMLHHWIYDILVNVTSLDRWHTGKCYIPGSMTYW